MKILIVDDSLMDRKLLTRTLVKAGITNPLIEAEDGESAFKILCQDYNGIGLILLDWQMPKMDGLEFMKAVLKVNELVNIPIIMITASSSDDSQKQAREVNPHLAEYIIKPYKPDALIAKIQPYLQKNT